MHGQQTPSPTGEGCSLHACHHALHAEWMYQRTPSQRLLHASAALCTHQLILGTLLHISSFLMSMSSSMSVLVHDTSTACLCMLTCLTLAVWQEVLCWAVIFCMAFKLLSSDGCSERVCAFDVACREPKPSTKVKRNTSDVFYEPADVLPSHGSIPRC